MSDQETRPPATTGADGVAIPNPLDTFVALSAVLTGFATSVLRPRTDAQGQASQYLSFLAGPDSGVAAELPALFAIYRANAGKPPQEIGAAIMASASAELARRIIKLWYTGSWYGAFDVANREAPMLRVVSSQAYTNGLVWKAAQAHAMGFSVFRFGYWNAPPPPLSDFTGQPPAAPESPKSPITVVPSGGPDHG